MMHTKSAVIDSARKALVAAAAIAACAAAATPALAGPSDMPSYATGEESIRGRIASFDGKYHLELRDDRGFVDRVSLHDGTVINPTGLRLSPGQSVTILGHNTGATFEANEIDTPYAHYGGVYPVYGYPYPAYGYYGYPYYGPAFGVGFRDRGFGFRGWF
jgi:hypothetical protein